MYVENFYQSKLWREINYKIFKRPIFKEKIFDKEFWGVIKEKNYFGFNTKWYQILGIDIPYDIYKNKEYILKEIKRIKTKYNSFKDIYMQLGFTNEVITFETSKLKDKDFVKNIKNERLNLQNYLLKEFNLKTSLKENMPLSNIVIDLSKTIEDIYNGFSNSSKRRIKKSLKNDIKFEIANDNDWSKFYKLRSNTSSKKGFNVLDKESFFNLKNYLLSTNQGDLFLIKQNGEITNGSICLFLNNTIVYLYGATDREKSSVGDGYILKYETMKRAKYNGFSIFDLLGGSPTGFDHPLVGVSRFKESFGGKKIEYFGSFDVPLSNILYYFYKFYKKN